MKNLSRNTHLAVFLCVLITQFGFSLLAKSTNEVLNFSSITNKNEISNEIDNKPKITAQNLRKTINSLNRTWAPKIVENVDERKKIIASPRMSKAETIRTNTVRETGYKEKPVLYTTIISPKQTAITHSAIKANPNEKTRMLKNKENSRKFFNIHKEEKKQPLQPGQYALRVSLSEKEKEKEAEEAQNLHIDLNGEINEEKYLKAIFAKLAETDLHKINNSIQKNDVDSSINSLLSIRKDLKTEAKELLINLRKRIKKIANINTIEEKLNGLLNLFYSEKKKGMNSDVKHLIMEYEEKMKSTSK